MPAYARPRRSMRVFLLHELLPMRPYVQRLLADLGEQMKELRRLRRLRASLLSCGAKDELIDANEAEFERLRTRRRELRRECRNLGALTTRDPRGTLLFPCAVDFRDAFFVWSRGENRPGRWRFQDGDDDQPIPPNWYSLFANDGGAAKRSV